jgi:ribosomal protein L40E
MMLGIGGSLCTIFAFHFVGMILATPLVILIIIGFFFILRAFITGRLTRYFLTNKRLIETRRGVIVKEVSLDKFQDRPLSQFLVKSAAHTKDHQHFYTLRITDPVSGEVLMELGDLDENSVEAFERITKVVKCSYCGSKNPANSLKCSHCGAPL